MKLQTDYAGHDRTYKRLRAEGKNGWSEDIEDNDSRKTWVRGVIDPMLRSGNVKVLFLGCGAGEYAVDASLAGVEATGIDISPTAIEMARERAVKAGATCKFFVGSVLDLPFADKFFNLVVDDHCLHCIIGDDRKKFLSESSRVLNSGGILLVRSMCSLLHNPSPEFLSQFDPVSRCQVVKGIAGRYFASASKIVEEVKSAGFKIINQAVFREEYGTDMLELMAQCVGHNNF